MSAVQRNRLLFYGAIILVLVADQASKAWVMRNLPYGSSMDLAPWLSPIFSLTKVRNTGVAFGMFPQLGRLPVVLSALVVVGVLLFRHKLPVTDYWLHAALGLVVGGAIGNNLLDRLLLGYVIDFIDVNFWPLASWPVFNLADSAIVVGVGILLLDSFLAGRRETGAHDAGTADI